MLSVTLLGMIAYILTTLVLMRAVMADKPQQAPATGITPIPYDKINPRANEFRRLDTDGDEQITFTEFLLGDNRYIERQSAAFHRLDEDGDGIVSRAEYDAYYKRIDDDRRQSEIDRENFFNSLDHGHFDQTPFFHGFFPVHYYSERSRRPYEKSAEAEKNDSKRTSSRNQ